MKKIALTVAMIACSSAQYSIAESPASGITGAYMLQVTGSLLLVFGCIFALFFAMRKLNSLPAKSDSALGVIGSIRLGNREKAVLIKVGDKQLLIGVTPGSVNTLHELETPLELPVNAQSVFADVLAKRMNGGEQ